MSPRMNNPSLVVPDGLQPLLDLTKAIAKVVPQRTLDLVRLRVSQVNGRTYILAPDLGKAGDADVRLHEVATWRDASCFTDAERAALGLAEAVTVISDRDDPVPDEVWDEAARHHNEQELGALVMHVGLVNLWNRVNVAVRQDPQDWR